MVVSVPSGKRLQFAIENGPVEIVSLPINSMVDLSSSQTVNVYQRVVYHYCWMGFYLNHQTML